tara:strand:- start:222 stop:353 length:132 start_codon:yes stop_codon:yes gene_type:complete
MTKYAQQARATKKKMKKTKLKGKQNSLPEFLKKKILAKKKGKK